MSLSFGTSEISPLSMFGSLGTTPWWDRLRLSSGSAPLTHGDGRERRDAPCLRQMRALPDVTYVLAYVCGDDSHVTGLWGCLVSGREAVPR